MDYIKLIENVSIYTVTILVIGYLIRYVILKSIDNKYNQQLESFKNELKLKSLEYQSNLDNKIEHLKSELERFNYEHRVSYNQIYLEKFNIYNELYHKLLSCKNIFSFKEFPLFNYLDLDISDYINWDNVFNDFFVVYNDFAEFHTKNEIFFSDELNVKIKKFVMHSSGLVLFQGIDHAIDSMAKMESIKKHKTPENIKRLREAIPNIKSDIEKLQIDIRLEIQKDIGIKFNG